MEAEDYFAWFDMRRRSILRMAFGGGIDKTNLVEGIDAYLATIFDEIEAEASPNIFDSDNPITGKGIASVYDSRFQMGLMTFKYSITISGRTIERDFSLGFSKELSKYIGFFSFTPGIWVEHNGLLLANKIVRPTILNSTAYIVGDELYDATVLNGGNYVCIAAYTSANPAIIPSLDTTNWIL